MIDGKEKQKGYTYMSHMIIKLQVVIQNGEICVIGLDQVLQCPGSSVRTRF